MTNFGSRYLPRETRVLGYLGYVILLGATVVYFNGQKVVATGRAASPVFEPEAITQAALFRVALPVLVLQFLLRPTFSHAQTSAVAR